jgi:salicylate hydroxylase
MESLRVFVVGAGLGGLTAAACLRRAGYDVTVFEQAAALGEVGAGVQIGPNAVRVLQEIGLIDAFEKVAVRPTSLDVCDWKTGGVLNTIILGESYEARYGLPYYHVHRADLHALLADAFEAMAPDRIRLNAKCVGLDQLGPEIRLTFADGTTAVGDVVIGADGIHSSVREGLFGPDNPRFTGIVAFRGTVPLDRMPPGMIERKGYNWSGPDHHFVHYLLKGGSLMNCVGVCDKKDWRVESWSVEGDMAEFRSEFSGWHETIQSLIDGMDRCFKWALYDREPLDQWSRGHATLLGDACHPMLPFLAQGACMAIEDGYVLTHCLRTNDNVAAALKAYERIRLPRVSRVQLGARERGESLHLTDPKAMAERNARNAADPELRAREMDWIYDHDVVAEYGAL